MKEELKQQTAELLLVQRKLRDTQSQLANAENVQLPIQLDLAKVQREKDVLARQLQWVESELNMKSAEWTASRQLLISKCADLESQLTTERTDNESKTQSIISLQVRLVFFF